MSESQVPGRFVRRSEWALSAFLLYAAIMAAVMPLPPAIRVRTIGLNLTLLSGYAWLVSRPPRKYWSMARDWLPLSLTLLAYREMGWFARPHTNHSLEARWVVWDHVVLRGGAKAAIESLGPVLPSLLEVAYLLVYALGPFSVAMLYIYGHRNRVDRFLFLFVTGVLLCYAQFPFWPSEPPRAVFPTEDLPAYITVFRRWNLWLLGAGGIHTSVFPSGHVAAAFSAALGMWLFLPEHKWVGRLLGVTAVLIAVATVYGRYHYLVDAVAGLLMVAAAFLITRSLRPRDAFPEAARR
jgi:membrane-associated phospholipid phosphatase